MRRIVGFLIGLGGAAAIGVAFSPAGATAPALIAPPPAASPVASRVGAEPPPTLPRPRARHAVIISEDGLRPDALDDVRPPVHTAVMARGARALDARTIRLASTLPSHASMLSGFDVKAHGLHWNSWQPARGYIQVPTVFDAADSAGGSAAAFVGKWKLQHIAQPGSVAVFERPGYLCRKVVDAAARYFVAKRPEVMFVHFSDPDEHGHLMGWMSETQLAALHKTDRCLEILLRAVAEAGLESETLFILSSDHGGHGRNHSGAVPEDRRIPWIAWGAGVKAGHVIEAPVSTLDTAATVLWALGYPAPAGLAGRPVVEAFTNPDSR